MEQSDCARTRQQTGMVSSGDSMLRLPLDVQLQIVSILDGQSYASLVEMTSRALASALAPFRSSFWEALLRALPTTTTVLPRTDDVKSDYVRAWAMAQSRCPRCGKQSRRCSNADEESLPDEDAYLRSQSHMCEFLPPVPPSFRARSSSRTAERVSPMMARCHEVEEDSPSSSASARPMQQTSLAAWLVPAPLPQVAPEAPAA